jgi:hypothetical protein
VSWWSVHEYVAPILAAVGTWPTLGSAEWVALPDHAAAKWAAILSAAEHWSLRLECCQEGLAQASRDVSTAENWSAIATEITQRRSGGYIPREIA